MLHKLASVIIYKHGVFLVTLFSIVKVGGQVMGNNPPRPGSFPTIIVWNEDTPVGTVIGNLSAIDTDGPQPLTFTIAADSTTSLVNLSNMRDEGSSGMRIVDIVLKEKLDCDFEPLKRNLYFTISDGSSEIPAKITLFISDINDNPPLFKNLPYKVTVNESIAVGTLVYKDILATDPDNGLGGTVSYNMTTDAQDADNDYRSTFSINQYDGKITLVKGLDYEKHNFYQFKINAEDGEHLQAVPADFIVTVLDVQDTPPIFINLPYSQRVFENITSGTQVIQVAAIDQDRGIPNAMSYSFIRGDYSKFAINNATGWISLAPGRSLDRDSPEMASNGGVYAMYVQASEIVPAGQINYGATTATALVTITVADINDNAPVFSASQYTATILENMQSGVPITFVLPSSVMRVSDADQGTNSHFSLSLERNGKPYGDFTTIPQEVYSESTVLVQVNNPTVLDYEQTQQIIFQVVAREVETAERRSSTATVTLSIQDMNDNSPVFNATSYHIWVAENASVGARIGAIQATDQDSGLYGNITYSIRGGNERFRVDPYSGVISLALPLDRETTSEYSLTAEAKDGGGQRTPVEIQVTVRDVNDNAPLFQRSDYEGVVREGNPNFLRPVIVQAVDDDEQNTSNSLVRYRIEQTPPGLERNFTINSTSGEITLVQPLDYEGLDPAMQGEITLKIVAYDAGVPQKSSVMLVNINVEDVNDYKPVFSPALYNVRIMENSNEGTHVVTVTATDGDGTSPNNNFFYRIDSGALDKFRINFETGEITVEAGARLNREEKSQYSLRVSATDRGNSPLTGFCNVTITLDNINDEKPAFAEPARAATVAENLASGSSVLAYTATDSDDDSSLRYSVLRNLTLAYDERGDRVDAAAKGVDRYFDINSTSGVVFVASTLDRETAERIVITIMVEDVRAVQPPQQTATAVLTITLLDYNDNSPTFVPSNQYTVNVSEALALDSLVLRVEATDADRGQEVGFELASSGDANWFKIDASTGVVALRQKLDYENKTRLTFLIVAKDNGSPQRSSTATVVVSVKDENDNMPEFLAYPALFTVPENVSVNYSVYTMTAEDRDSGEYGHVIYSLEGIDSDEGAFRIDPSKGEITVAAPLDRERKAEYRLEVLARDNAPAVLDQKSRRTPVFIRVTDVNDNAPMFESSGPSAPTVAEIASPGTSVFTAKANDPDEGPNGDVEYYLTSDTNATRNNRNLFQIGNTTGIVSVTQLLHGLAATYAITVGARDHGANVLSSTQSYVVVVYDVNDDTPKFVRPNPMNPVVPVPEDIPIGGQVLVLEAVDTDTGPNGQVAYTLVQRQDKRDWESFDLDPDTGRLTTNRRLDREQQSEYQLIVRATDHGVPTNFSSDLTLTVRVQDVNDQPPEFDRTTVSSPYLVHFRENEGGQCANINVAVDRDSDPLFTVICYYLAGVEQVNVFELNTTGALCVKPQAALDREQTTSTNLVVLATDSCYDDGAPEVMTPSGSSAPALYSSANTSLLWVKVVVDDVNDHQPVFARSDLAVGLTRTTQFGTIIYNLKDEVTDADSDQWGISRFENTTGFVAQPDKLVRDIADSGINTPFLLFGNGSIKTNMYFKADMSGYFTVGLKVYDKGGFSATATLRISLISDNQRLKVVFRQPVGAVANIKVSFAQRMSAITNYRIVVDQIQTHENDNGVAEPDKTDMFIHGEVVQTNSIVPAETLLSYIDQLSSYLVPVLNDYNILQIAETSVPEQDKSTEKRLQMALILVSVILGALCIILVIVLYCTHRRYSRKLKAATAMAYVNSGVGPDEADLYKVDIPGTNMHAYENSNPVYLEKIMLEGDDDGQMSLDENALSDSGHFEEQEVAMNIYLHDRETTNNNNNDNNNSHGRPRVDYYLKAAISEHEGSRNLQTNDLHKDRWEDKMMMSQHALATPHMHGSGSGMQETVDPRLQPLTFRSGRVNDGLYLDEPDEFTPGSRTTSFVGLPLTEI